MSTPRLSEYDIEFRESVRSHFSVSEIADLLVQVLDPDCARVIELRFFQDPPLSQREIAKRLGYPEGRISRYKKTGVRKLSRLVRKIGGRTVTVPAWSLCKSGRTSFIVLPDGVLDVKSREVLRSMPRPDATRPLSVRQLAKAINQTAYRQLPIPDSYPLERFAECDRHCLLDFLDPQAQIAAHQSGWHYLGDLLALSIEEIEPVLGMSAVREAISRINVFRYPR